MADEQWSPVATQAVGVFERVPPGVQLATIAALTIIVLAALYAWSRKTSVRGKDTEDVLARLMTDLMNEIGAQMSGLKTATENLSHAVTSMQEAVTGCRDCPFERRKSHGAPSHHTPGRMRRTDHHPQTEEG